MIVLDTNVVSAMMRLHLEPIVEAWLGQQSRARLHLTTPVIFEIRFGIERLPAGRRRRELEAAQAELLTSTFRYQIIDLEPEAADAAGLIHARQIGRGRNVEITDSLIAGIATILGATIATRDVDDFAGLGIDVVNPWASA